MVYAQASDVIDRWIGPSAPADAGQVALLIGDAEVIIDREFPNLSDSSVTADEIKLVVVAMVTRVYRNPEGVASRTIGSDGAFGGSVTYAGANPGALVLTDEERAILGGTTASGAFSVDTAPGWGDAHGETCALRFGASYCSCGTDIAGYPLYEILP